MANVLRGRWTNWALVLWSAYITTWMVLTESGPVYAAAWWVAGTACAALLLPTYRLRTTRRPLPQPEALHAPDRGRLAGHDGAAPGT